MRIPARSSPAPLPQPPVAGPSGTPAVDECFAYCEAVARAHHENFPIGSPLLPAALRPHVAALYAFVRTADDFADEPAYAGKRRASLDRWEDLVHRCFHGEADHPLFVALADTVQRFDLPIQPFLDILDAFRLDLTVRRYPTFGDLMAYVARSAHPVARLLLYVFGARDAERHRYGEELATALALTAFWQDVARDLERDRIYLPVEDLRHFGVSEDDLFARRESPALGACLRAQLARTRAYFERARPLLGNAPADGELELGLFFHGGLRALEKLEHHPMVFGPRVSLHAADKALVLARASRDLALARLRRRS